MFPILTGYTVVYMALVVYDFVAREAFDIPSSALMAVYMAITGAYAADKELKRWAGKAEPPRTGSIFVYLWLAFFLVTFVVYCFLPTYKLPVDLEKVALQVLGIFFGSKVSKKFYGMKAEKELAAADREDVIMGMVKENGKVTRKEVMEGLKLSRNSAWVLLSGMEKKKMIKQVGEKKGTYYALFTA